MNLLVQLFLVTTAITVMIILRMVSDRRALRQRLRDGTGSRACGGGCGRHSAENEPPEYESNADRSACHAP